jgi:hypothetical protein
VTAAEYFSTFTHPDVNGEVFNNLLPYMSVQKLRTPKGLKNISAYSLSESENFNLIFLQRIQNLYCAIWTECVWQIAEATESNTKFIISDHPVTVYNRACPPLSKFCREYNDPDIRLHATHTIFPLSLEKMLILTNLSWVRDPY